MSNSRIHIHAPAGYYLGQVRRCGHRRWSTVTGRCKSSESAMSKAALQMRGMHCARVLFISSCGYYDPIIIMECTR